MTDTASQKPTETAMSELQTAYDFYNRELFDAELPACLITLQRNSLAVTGYFSWERFATNTGKQTTDEIALNPVHFRKKVPTEILQTLVHEMCHLWHFRCAPKSQKPKKPGYHSKVWAAKMESVGLMPSHDGKPGGKKTGYQMMDYPIPDGPFDIATQKLLTTGYTITWYDRVAEILTKPPSLISAPVGTKPNTAIKTPQGTRRKFSCQNPKCSQIAYGKGSLKIICGLCNEPMV